jgi:regulation of enolase protein 1 (concanavalin A-like superfamily)
VWHRTFGGVEGDYGSDIVECEDGGYAIIGGTMSMGAGETDAIIVRTDAEGNELWSQTYGSEGSDSALAMVECSTGGFAFTGYSRNGTLGRHNLWLVRTDASGNVLWERLYGGVDNDQGFGLIEVSTGGFAVVGITRSFGSVDPRTLIHTFDIWLLRTDTQGHLLWNRTYGGAADDISHSIVEVLDGGFAFSGEFNSSYQALGGGPLIESHPDAFIIRTDANGEALWNQTYGGTANDFSRAIVQLDDGSFAISGFTNTASEDPYDGLFIRANSSGYNMFQTTHGSAKDDFFQAIITCDSTGFVLAGYTYLSDSADLWLIRTNTDGTPLWVRTFGGPEDDLIRAGIQSQDGFVLTGYTFSFGAGSRDIWLVKISDSPPIGSILVVSGIFVTVVVMMAVGTFIATRFAKRSRREPVS